VSDVPGLRANVMVALRCEAVEKLKLEYA